MTENIYLTGFMGAGKTTVGRRLAEALKRRFVDLDARLELRFKRPIPAVFAELGEAAFRREESRLLRQIARRERLIVATGGGLVEREDNRTLMRRSGRVVHLEADLLTCRRRLTSEEIAARPRWRDLEAAGRLLDQRRPLYRDCDLSVAVADKKPGEIVREIVAGLFPDRELIARLEGAECPILTTFDAPAGLARLIDGRRTAILTDRTVARLHLDRFAAVLDEPLVITIRGGERAKTLAGAGRILRTLLDHGVDRGDFFVALGGGVVTDLGAFVAATYKRGLDFALVSTTLLGCVDAAVGGKSGVNLGPAKNAVGCFTVPAGVVLDTAAHKTLGRKQLAEGLIEAYKTGLVAEPRLVELIEAKLGALKAGDLPLLAEVIRLSAGAKAEVVGRDFRESGRRAILNLGHTFGHAVESWGEYRLGHGRAVALGLIVAVRLSRNRGLITAGLAERIETAIGRIIDRPTAVPPLEAAWEIMKHDKKIRRGRMVFVLLADLAEPVMVDDVGRDELAAVVDGL